jgi:hypothetical protein
VISDARVPSNALVSQGRSHNQSELREWIYTQMINRSQQSPNIYPLAKNVNGYVEIEPAWDRLLQKPALPTEEFDEVFFPPDQAAEHLGNGRRRCRVKASVTRSGPAEWVPHPSNKPCGHKLDTADGYRRHVITQHLACTRGSSSKQADWISEPWFLIT